MAVGIYMFWLILINIQLSSQKPQTSIMSKFNLFQKKYDYILADVMKINQDLENIWENISDNQVLHDKILESVKRLENSTPTVGKFNEKSANESISYSREFIDKFQRVQKGIREEKHVIRKRLTELEDMYINDVCKCEDATSLVDIKQRELRTSIDKIENNQNDMRMNIVSKQQSIIDKVDTLRYDQDKILEVIASKQRVILDNVDKLQTDQDNIRKDVTDKKEFILNSMDKLLSEVTSMQTKSEEMYNKLENEQRNMIAEIENLQSKVASLEITIENQKNEIHTTKAIVQTKTLKLIIEGWTQYSNSVYKAFYTQLDWTNAMTSCRSFGGFLADIQSADEMKFVTELVEPNISHFWLGGCDRDTEGEWKWCHTNDDITYDGWYTGQPDNWHGGEDCMHGYRNDPIGQGKWNDARCHLTYVYVCEVPIAT